jgi:EAL and modified HD-GYP domain-containing signal transduction protein
MQIPTDTRKSIHIARQPILDWSRRVVGYELLYRDSDTATACTEACDVASARVLSDTLLGFGIDTLTGGRPAFLNITQPVLMSGAVTLLPPAHTVVELRETIDADAQVVETCRSLQAAGYALALDDFTGGGAAEPLLPFARFVKIDVLATPPDERRALAKRLQSSGVVLVAEKVETAQMAEETRAEGFSLFQGFYFCKPSTKKMAALPGRRMAYFELFSALNKPDISVAELEDLVKHDVSLSYRVLRSVNSAAFAQQREVSSIRHALMLLGLEHIRKWCSIWSLSGANGSGAFETVVVTLLRARCCELVGNALGGAETGNQFFLLGLCSLLDALLGVPMAEAIGTLPLSATLKRALEGEPNIARQVLDTVIAYERGQWDDAFEIGSALGLAEGVLPNAYADALRWAREFLPTAAAA